MAITRIGPNQSINLASNITGTLPTGNGGTGATSFSPGKVLNVYQAVTPTSSSSKFLLMPKVHYSSFGGGEGFNLKILRAISGGASTDINAFPTNGAYLRYQDANANFYDYFSYDWLDEPSTASAVTYTIQVKVNSGESVKFSGYNSQTYSMFTILEIGA